MYNKTILTSTDIKDIMANVFTSNTTTLTVIDENGEKSQKMFHEYLNVEFFSWRNRVEKGENWFDSIQNSLYKAFCLCEITDESTSGASDYDSEQISGKLTFLIQADKCGNLEYYCKLLRNQYLGKVQTLTNSYGENLKAYIDIGCLLYDEEPETTQVGESIVCSLNFGISYVSDTSSYSDTQVFVGFEDFENGNLLGTALPLTKSTWQLIFTGQVLTNQVNPTITGRVNASQSQTVTLQFYDFQDNEFIKQLNHKFFENSAVAKWNGTAWETDLQRIINIPIYLAVKVKNGTEELIYKYKFVLVESEKVLTNGDFNISSITLATYGKK